MANKYDLKTWAKLNLTTATVAGTNIGSGVVPTGKTRFLTYIRVQRTGTTITSLAVGSMLLAIASIATSKPTAASALKATALLLPIHLPGASKTLGEGMLDQVYSQEIRGSIENPILSVGGGAFMGIMGSKTAGKTADVFAQYYDE